MEEAGRRLSEDRPNVRTAVLLFLGKGGAGKTTTAAATAVGLARAGRRTLIVSLDQAHSAADVFGVDAASPADRASAGVRSIDENLDLLELDTSALLEQRYRDVLPLVSSASSGHDHGVAFGAVAPQELMGLPGVEELLGLHEVVRWVEQNRWHTVIVDFPASADALRTLQLPDTAISYAERVWPRHDRMVAGTGTDLRLTVVVAMIERVLGQITAVREMLHDPNRTRAVVVANAEAVSVSETERTLAAAQFVGVRVGSVIVNRFLPQLNSGPIDLVGAHPAVFWFERWRGAQVEALRGLRGRVGAVPIRVVEQSHTEPVGLAALGELAEQLESVSPGGDGADDGTADDGNADDGTADDGTAPTVVLESGSGLESVYTMTMPLPVVNASTLGLGRVEDELIVSADGRRRRVVLASVLRRCVVDSAELDGGDLVVRFRPDPAVWPT